MKIALSVPSGFHIRELLLPLKEHLEKDADITTVLCITPGAPWQSELFPAYGPKFEFVENPQSQKDHTALIAKHAPDIVITNTSGLDARDVPILHAAKENKRKTVTFIASWDNVWKMERLKKYKKPQILADHLIVWNTMMQEHLKRIFPQYPKNNIRIIGAPRLDFFHHNKEIPSREELLHHLKCPPDAKKLIHFASTSLYPIDYVVRSIAQAAHTRKIKDDLRLYVSIHPGGDITQHETYAKKYDAITRYSFGRHKSAPHPDFVYNPTLEDVYMLVALFKHTDILINQSSTVAIESFAANTPVINVKYGRPLDWWRWYRSMVYRDFQQHYRNIVAGGATKVVTSPKQLIEATKRYLKNPNKETTERAATYKKMVTTTDGSAGRKVLDYIKSIHHTDQL